MNSLTQSLSRETTMALLSIAMSLTKKTYGISHSCPLQTVWGCEGMQQKASSFMVGWQVCVLTTGSAISHHTVFSKAQWKGNLMFWINQFLLSVWIKFEWPASMVGFPTSSNISPKQMCVCMCLCVCVCVCVCVNVCVRERERERASKHACTQDVQGCSPRFDKRCVFDGYTSWEGGCLIPARICLEECLPLCFSVCRRRSIDHSHVSHALPHWPLRFLLYSANF